jgi:hypothetical protein
MTSHGVRHSAVWKERPEYSPPRRRECPRPRAERPADHEAKSPLPPMSLAGLRQAPSAWWRRAPGSRTACDPQSAQKGRAAIAAARRASKRRIQQPRVESEFESPAGVPTAFVHRATSYGAIATASGVGYALSKRFPDTPAPGRRSSRRPRWLRLAKPRNTRGTCMSRSFGTEGHALLHGFENAGSKVCQTVT